MTGIQLLIYGAMALAVMLLTGFLLALINSTMSPIISGTISGITGSLFFVSMIMGKKPK
ncbi:hypothetical protein ACFL0R_00875 [Pseudomonadota bacterium]